MTFTSFASLLACALFIGAMLHVVATDLLHRRIRNWLVGALGAAYLPLAVAAGLPGSEILMAAFAALLMFGVAFGSFAAGWIGGGDAKLAPACVMWLGADQALSFVALTSLFGGALALAAVAMGALRRGGATAIGSDAPPVRRLSLPYGPALAIAGLVLLRESPWVRVF